MIILENLKLAKKYKLEGKLSEEDFNSLVEADPTPQKKYVGWMSKMWINEKPYLDDLSNYIYEFDLLLNKGKTITKDINQFSNFTDLKDEIDEINESGGNLSTKELENDYEVIMDNEDLLIINPNTHEASRKLGLTKFAFRDCENGSKDSAWCTTFKLSDQWSKYYFTEILTFYYTRIKSNKLKEKIKEYFPEKHIQFEVMAITVSEDGSVIEGWDGLDGHIVGNDIKLYCKIIGIL